MSGEPRNVSTSTRRPACSRRRTADLPPTYHIVGRHDREDRRGDLPHPTTASSPPATCPSPAWSFTLSEATVTLDDYARMKDVAFRAGTVPAPLHAVPDLADEGGPRLGHARARASATAISAAAILGPLLLLGHRAADGPDDAARRLHRRLDRRGESKRAGGRPPSRRASSRATSSTTRPPRSAFRSRRPRPAAATASARCPTARSASTRWSPRPAGSSASTTSSDDLPFGFRGVLSIRDYSDQQYLQDFERNFALNSARQIVSRGFLTKNFGSDSLNLRFERSETFYSSTVLQERFPTLEFFHRTAPIGDSPFYLSLLSSISGLFINRGRDFAHGTYGRFDLYPIFSFPFKSIPWLSLTAQRRRPVYGVHGLDRRLGTDFTGDAFTAALRRGRASPSSGPSFSRIYDVKIGPWDKLKHVIEPRVDYSYVSNVDDPGEIPAFDEVDNALGHEPGPLRHRQPPARALGRVQGLRGGDRVARDRPDLRLRAPADARPDPARIPGSARPARSRAILRLSPGRPPAPRRARLLRPVRQPADVRDRHRGRPTGGRTTSTSAGSAAGPSIDDAGPGLQLRPAPLRRRHRPRQVLPVRHLDRLRRAVRTCSRRTGRS